MPDLPLKHYLYYAGIDPGHKGAVGLMNATGTSIRVWKMPVTEDGADVDLPGLRAIFKHLRRMPDCAVGIEWPQAWPGSFANVTRDAENFGRQKGYLEAFAYLHGLDYFRLAPTLWKGRLGLDGKETDTGSKRAAGLWDTFYPEARDVVRGPRGGLLDGPLDALLMAHFLRTRTSTGMKSMAAKFGKGSAELMAFALGGGRRKRKQFGM